jgi:sugar O-acyltransferase (sialic acid O-acetyltransferase NeuD family)
MLIIGTGGFARELLEVLNKKGCVTDLAFYNDVNSNITILFERFNVLKNEQEVEKYFLKYGNEFMLGIGNPFLRYQMNKKFEKLGGKLTGCISDFARVGKFEVKIGCGTNVMDNAIISNSVQIGIGCIIYYNVIVTHDCVVKDFVEISPSANILGRCTIESFAQIGSNATILPDIKIGRNAVVGAGAVVTKNVEENTLVVGVPAIFKKKLKIN